MKFRPSLDGHYKRRWAENERFEEVKARIRSGSRDDLIPERNHLEEMLSRHVRECRLDLVQRTAHILCNPTWRRLILGARAMRRLRELGRV